MNYGDTIDSVSFSWLVVPESGLYDSATFDRSVVPEFKVNNSATFNVTLFS